MSASKMHSLKFQFEVQGWKLNPGDIIFSLCSPTDITHLGRSVVYSPGGFPLHFTLHLVYVKEVFYPFKPTHWFLLQLRLEQPSDIPCLPPLHIQPMPISSLPLSPRPGTQQIPQLSPPVYLAPCLVGPQQPANWGLRWNGTLDSTWSGEFQFLLLDEPLRLIANLPPLSQDDWSCLPQDMISAVLRELPLPDLVSARLVCHEWKRILDTDSRAWANVTHLQSISKGVWREELWAYHHRRLNQVRGGCGDRKLYKALGFLAARKAPLNTLELVHSGRDAFHEFRQEDIEPLPYVLCQHNIKLKAFSLQATDEELSSAVLKLIRSQPSLERVYLETREPIPLTHLLEALPRLRILSLHKVLEGYLEAFQTHLPQLSRLDGIRVGSADPFELASISSSLASHSDLRRAEIVNLLKPYKCTCGCKTYGPGVVWGSANLSPAAAAFLLMPQHSSGSEMASVLHHHL